MKQIHLNLKKLLGFKIVAEEFGPSGRVVIGAKLGEKEGLKPAPATARLGAKIGAKLGAKIGAKLV
jgi:hypothetical protein